MRQKLNDSSNEADKLKQMLASDSNTNSQKSFEGGKEDQSYRSYQGVNQSNVDISSINNESINKTEKTEEMINKYQQSAIALSQEID